MSPSPRRRSAAPHSALSRRYAPRAWQRALTQPHVAIAVFATLAVLWTLSPAGLGPGATCDEPYYLLKGKAYVTAWSDLGLRLFQARNIDRVMGFQPGGPPPHPPLGVWILGWTQCVFDPAPRNPFVIALAGARFAPALAFGVLVYLVGAFTAREAGGVAGVIAAFAAALMPRLFGHAHLAALDTFAALTCFAAIHSAVATERRGGLWWHYALAGIVWGLAMLTKINGLLVAPPIGLWLMWRLRRRAIAAIGAWGAAGLATLLVGWPWLWGDPLGRLAGYLGSGVDRVTLNTFYLGQVWPDRDVPWHYPWVMFAVTVPLGLLAFGVVGGWTCLRPPGKHPGAVLVVGGIGMNLMMFSVPGVPVYDGVRLFLPAFPLFACLVGLGAQRLLELPFMSRHSPRRRALLLTVLLAGQGIGLAVCHPYQLSYYNALVGGLWGAERLGFETTYWGDTVRGPVLREAAAAARGGGLLFGPNLAPFQSLGVIASQPILADDEVDLIGWDASQPDLARDCHYAILYRRQADLDQVRFILEHGQVIAEDSRQGVWLTRLYRLPESAAVLYRTTLPAGGAGP